MSLGRLPIRWRLALGFVLASGLLVAGVGAGVHVLLSGALTGQVHDRLRRDARAVASTIDPRAPRIRAADPALLPAGVGFAQLVDRAGEVVASTPAGATRPAVGPRTLRDARRGPRFVRAGTVPGVDPPTQLLVRPLDGALRGTVLVVGGSLADRDAAMRRVDVLLLVGGPLAVLLLTAGAYALAGAALRPVSAMRRDAVRMIGERRPGTLALPRADDEIRALGATLNELLAAVRAAVAHEREFLARASHELRTPLAVLAHELELAAAGSRTEAEVRDAIASALEESRLLTRISADLLLLARADAGEPLLHRTRALDADDVLLALRDRFAPRAREVGRRIVVEETGAVLVADPDRLHQALGNLVDNALRHGTGDVGLRAAEVEGGGHVVSVLDDGPGLPDTIADRAYEPFTRGTTAGDGSGLGLAIVRSIARAHGGEVRHRTRADGRHEAAIELPAVVPDGAVGPRA